MIMAMGLGGDQKPHKKRFVSDVTGVRDPPLREYFKYIKNNKNIFF